VRTGENFQGKKNETGAFEAEKSEKKVNFWKGEKGETQKGKRSPLPASRGGKSGTTNFTWVGEAINAGKLCLR